MRADPSAIESHEDTPLMVGIGDASINTEWTSPPLIELTDRIEIVQIAARGRRAITPISAVEASTSIRQENHRLPRLPQCQKLPGTPV